MKTYIVPVHAKNGDEEQTFELVMNCENATDAHRYIDALIAHGHTISGMVGGIESGECEEIEGYDATGEKADALTIYVIGTTNFDDIGDGELSVIGDATECAREIFQRAKALYLTA